MNNKANRKYYIDNIRILCILMLFPFHTAMIFNGFGENWYLHAKSNLLAADLLNRAVYPWWMSGLFALAGMSTVYSLKHRTSSQYRNERYKKLLIPFLSSLVLVVPVQSYLADKYYNNYDGNYIAHISSFLTLSDWSGYDGHFTPGHTWFILYLFLISMAALPFIMWYKNREVKIDPNKLNMIKIIPMFLIPMITRPILDIGGKSIGEFGAYFLLGYLVLSYDEVQERLEKNCIPLGIAWILLIIIRCTMYVVSFTSGPIWNLERELLGWIGILAMIGLGKRFLEFNNWFTKYFVFAQFPVYIFHQSVIVIVGYFVLKTTLNSVSMYFAILCLSFIATMILYEICRRISITRFLFGIKK